MDNKLPAPLQAFALLGGMMNSQVVSALFKTNVIEQLGKQPAAAEELYTLNSLFYDLHMQVMLGGCERTEEEFRTLFHSAGLKLDHIIPTKSPMKIIVASC
jgi:hypothetical protein